MWSRAWKRLTAVGREAARVALASLRSSPRSAARAMPYAAATPIEGAPRTASVRIASATSAELSSRSSTTSPGSSRWSRTMTAPSSKRTISSGRRPGVGLRSVVPCTTVPRRSRALPGGSCDRSSPLPGAEGGGAWGNHGFPHACPLVPAREVARLLLRELVDAMPIVSSFSRAISSSISCGTT